MRAFRLAAILSVLSAVAGCSEEDEKRRDREERIEAIRKQREFLIQHKNNLEAQIRATTNDFNSNDPEVVRLRWELQQTLQAIDASKDAQNAVQNDWMYD